MDTSATTTPSYDETQEGLDEEDSPGRNENKEETYGTYTSMTENADSSVQPGEDVISTMSDKVETTESGDFDTGDERGLETTTASETSEHEATETTTQTEGTTTGPDNGDGEYIEEQDRFRGQGRESAESPDSAAHKDLDAHENALEDAKAELEEHNPDAESTTEELNADGGKEQGFSEENYDEVPDDIAVDAAEYGEEDADEGNDQVDDEEYVDEYSDEGVDDRDEETDENDVEDDYKR